MFSDALWHYYGIITGAGDHLRHLGTWPSSRAVWQTGGPGLLLVVKTPMQKQLNCEANVHFDHTLISLSKAAVMQMSEVRCKHTKES